MPATSDLIQERRRVRRSLAIWRIVAVLAILVAIVLAIPRSAVPKTSSDHLARIVISGIIFDDPDRDRTLRQIAEADRAKALIVRINSPGGTVTGSEALFETLRKVAEKKPVVAVMGELATSGGYVAALGTDHIVARQTSLTGSIGVVSQVRNYAELLDSLGIEVREVKSSPLKAAPSATEPIEDEAIAALDAIVEDNYVWFRNLVSARRGLEGNALDEVTDGRVFSGRQAKENGLIDEIGAEPDALAWLEERHEIAADTAVVDYSWSGVDLPFPFSLGSRLLGIDLSAPGHGIVPGPQVMAIFPG